MQIFEGTNQIQRLVISGHLASSGAHRELARALGRRVSFSSTGPRAFAGAEAPHPADPSAFPLGHPPQPPSGQPLESCSVVIRPIRMR